MLLELEKFDLLDHLQVVGYSDICYQVPHSRFITVYCYSDLVDTIIEISGSYDLMVDRFDLPMKYHKFYKV